MLKNKRALTALSALVALTGCASYEADKLSMISQESAILCKQSPDVSVAWKTFDKEDCKTYLDRNVISEGYVPVQVTIRNDSKDPMYLNPNNFSVSVSPTTEVANKVHTSTAGRIIAWTIPGLIITPFLIPAVYDGIKSSEANKYLDADYESKSIKEHTIKPYESFNGLVFVPKKEASEPLSLTLVNTTTGEKVLFNRISN